MLLSLRAVLERRAAMPVAVKMTKGDSKLGRIPSDAERLKPTVTYNDGLRARARCSRLTPMRSTDATCSRPAGWTTLLNQPPERSTQTSGG